MPTSLPQEQAAKTNMVSVVRIQVFSIIQVEGRVSVILIYDWPCPHEAGKALHLLDKKEMGWLQAS